MKCKECKHNFRAFDLVSYYHDGEGETPNPDCGMYEKKCSICLSHNYELIKNYEYDLEAALEAIEIENKKNRRNFLKKYLKNSRKS